MKHNIPIICLSLLLSSIPAGAQSIFYFTVPDQIFEDQEFTVNIDIYEDIGCPDLVLESEIKNNETHLKVNGQGTCLGLSPAISESYRLSTTLSAKTPEHRRVFFRDKPLSLSFLPVEMRGFRKINHESPAKDELVSGIGLIRGWACQETGRIGNIKYQIDDEEVLPLPYGSARPDTEGTCATDKHISPRGIDHGYGGIVNWNAYPAGKHRFRLWVDGVLANDHEFEIAKTKGAFQTGLSKEVTVSGFPEQGQRSVLRWSEADQNFILVDTQGE